MSKQIKKIVLPEDFRVLAEGHSFNVSIAKAFGLTEAILLQNFHYWHQCNKGNDDMFKDGRVWFFRSIAQIVECYPYLSPDKVRYAIERLIESGFLLKGNYSEDKLKKACWYSLSDETLSLFGENSIPFGKTRNDLGNPQLNYSIEYIDNNNKEKEIDKSISKKKESPMPTEEEHQMFEEFRLAYNGRKRGHDTEFDYFISQNKDWREVLPLLIGAITKENELREEARSMRRFFPEQKNMQTYLNGKNRAWELYGEDLMPTSTPKESKDSVIIGGVVYR
jgi:hypothetical protein